MNFARKITGNANTSTNLIKGNQLMSRKTIKILIVDGHQFVLDMLQLFIEKYSGLELIGAASTKRDCLQILEKNSPDLVLVDFNFGEQTPAFLVRKIKENFPNVYVLAFSDIKDISTIKEILYVGASGFISKTVSCVILYEAIQAVVYCGRIYTSEETAEKLLQTSSDSEQVKKIASLSKKELEVLKGIASGYKKTQLADKLNISPNTLQTYKKRIFKKLGLSTDVGLCLFAVKYKLIKGFQSYRG